MRTRPVLVRNVAGAVSIGSGRDHGVAVLGDGTVRTWGYNATGQLGDTNFALADKAAQVCPVGVILPKRQGFAVPIGQRRFDAEPISAHVDDFKPVVPATASAEGRS